MNFHPTKAMLLVGLIAIVVPTTASSGPAAEVGRKPIPAYESERTITRLSTTETRRLREITNLAMLSDSTLTGVVQGEFQRLIAKSAVSVTAKAEVRDRLIGVSIVHGLHLYRDALAAWQAGHPVKSADRTTYETRLLQLRLVSPPMLAQGDSLISNVAARDSVRANGRSILYDESLLRAAIAGLEQAQGRVDALLGVK